MSLLVVTMCCSLAGRFTECYSLRTTLQAPLLRSSQNASSQHTEPRTTGAQTQDEWKEMEETHLRHCRKAGVVENQSKGPIREVKERGRWRKGWGTGIVE